MGAASVLGSQHGVVGLALVVGCLWVADRRSEREARVAERWAEVAEQPQDAQALLVLRLAELSRDENKGTCRRGGRSRRRRRGSR